MHARCTSLQAKHGSFSMKVLLGRLRMCSSPRIAFQQKSLLRPEEAPRTHPYVRIESRCNDESLRGKVLIELFRPSAGTACLPLPLSLNLRHVSLLRH